jgi:Zn-dependent peptidase ImmA (M78 family)
VYKRPLAVFYLPKPPHDFDALRDFRRLPDSAAGEFSPELILAIRGAHELRQNALELYAALDATAPELPSLRTRGRSADQLAADARELLGVDLETQFGWRDKYAALSGWTTALEHIGVLVYQAPRVGVEEMRAFSVGDRPLPVVAVNSKDAPRGRVFSMMHELGHILLHSAGLCDLREGVPRSSSEQSMEVYCNAFAASLLVPADALLAERLVAETRAADGWTDDILIPLARKYSVSREAMLRRFLTLGRTTEEFYQRRRDEFLKAYGEYYDDKEPGYAPYHRRIVSMLGKAYVRLALEAYHLNAITSADLSDFLGVHLKHVSTIEHDVAPKPG